MIVFQVSGYDKRTELLSVQYRLPIELNSGIRALAHIEPEDDGLGTYPIDDAAVRQIGDWLKWPLKADLYDWFVEPA